MDFNDLTQKFTQKVKQLSKDTAEEVQKLNKVRQLNGKVNDAKKQIESIYSEIGKKFYELHKDSVPEGFEEFIQTINDKQVEIGQLKEQLREVKGVVLCPGCNTEVSGDERFCPNCGSRMPEPVEPADEGDEDSVVVDAEDVTQSAADAAEEIKEAAAGMAEEAKDLAGDAKEAAADMAEDVKATAEDIAGDAKEAAADMAEDTKAAAEDIAGDVKDAAGEAADALKDTAEDLADAAKEKAGEIAQGAKKLAGEAADELKKAAETLKEDIGKMF